MLNVEETYERLVNDKKLKYLLFSDGIRTFCSVEKDKLENLCFSSDRDSFFPDFPETIYKELENTPDYLYACEEGLNKALQYDQITPQALCDIANRELRRGRERFPLSPRSTREGFARIEEIIKALKIDASLEFPPNENEETEKLHTELCSIGNRVHNLREKLYVQKQMLKSENLSFFDYSFFKAQSIISDLLGEEAELKELLQQEKRLREFYTAAEIENAMLLFQENKIGAGLSVMEDSRKLEKRLDELFEQFYKDDSPTLRDICSLVQTLHLIHPFSDGNGRNICMILLTCLLVKNNFYAPLQFDTSSFIGLSLDEITDETNQAILATKYLNQLANRDDKEHFLMAYYFICKHSNPGAPLCTEKVFEVIGNNPAEFLAQTKLYFTENKIETAELAKFLETVSENKAQLCF